ncbi:4844_t:CDS:2 [Ambispora gerdemannii]|uniref:4844_t:CDS:1 n=1 Tax=Ambispora gerdemannii TaxID=144530 RepID=A0A9N9BDA5_9GLOM|nr:4844_t:CDS:2 [Ambispora gerdemannii]
MPATRKHLHIAKPRRRQRAVSLTTRASRCGVKNYVNVLKSLHSQVEDFFPVTKEYMQEYIEVKRKQNSIKANSLDQYFQHIESYNMALGHGWDSEVFEPMMREVLEDLEQAEGKRKIERKMVDVNNITANASEEGVVASSNINPNNNGMDNNHGYAPSVTLSCFDASHGLKLESTLQISLANLDPNDPLLSLRSLCDSVARSRFPKRWGDVDPSRIYFRNDMWNDSQPLPLHDENSFKMFWSLHHNASVPGSEVHLVVYTRRSSGTDIDPLSTSIPIAPLTPRKSPPRITNPAPANLDMLSESLAPSPTFQQVKAITIRSPTKTYKSNIAVTDTTTFDSLLKFAIKKQPPPGKQFVLQSADGELEYMPEDHVRKVIFGTGHAEVIVRIEDMREIDFTQF